MLYRLALASLSCIAIQGCFTNPKQELSQQSLNVKSAVSTQFSLDNLTTRKQKQWQASLEQLGSSSKLENSQRLSLKPSPVGELGIENHVPLTRSKLSNAASKESVEQGNFMTLTPTVQTNTLGNPLYQLKLYANGQLLRVYTTVSGRASTQNRNRHRAGTEAPLPDGLYKVAQSDIPGTNPEVGRRFLPIQPLFQTGRTELGIHYDPSFEQRNGEDGTSGCIAVTNKSELDDLLNYVRIYRPKYLKVKIQ